MSFKSPQLEYLYPATIFAKKRFVTSKLLEFFKVVILTVEYVNEISYCFAQQDIGRNLLAQGCVPVVFDGVVSSPWQHLHLCEYKS